MVILLVLFIICIILYIRLVKEGWYNNNKHFNFVEIGTSDFDTEIQKAGDSDVGLSVEPLKKYLDRLPNKPNCVKVNELKKRGYAIKYQNETDTVMVRRGHNYQRKSRN